LCKRRGRRKRYHELNQAIEDKRRAIKVLMKPFCILSL